MQCFVIMPFSEPFDDVYDTIKMAVTTSVAGETLTCCRLDEIRGAGRITDDLVSTIQHCDICVADLTGNNPNVLWEVGYAMALRKPTVFIAQNLENLPFDIKDMRVLKYSRERLAASLREPVADAIRATLAKHAVPRENTKLKEPISAAYSIAITGSSNADPLRVERRLPVLLRPHLSPNTIWYCGSSGTSDEVVLRYLITEQQKVVVVGYHQYDLSETVLELIKNNDLQFLDPNQLSLPVPKEPLNVRNVFFAARADFVILLWNGKSRGIKKMTDSYRANSKDFQLAFV
jgi:hypothetical protein